MAMKYGDIIKLVSPMPDVEENQLKEAITVAVKTKDDIWQTAVYSQGKLAIFLGESKNNTITFPSLNDCVDEEAEFELSPSRYYIFIDGMIGWVYKGEAQKFISV